MIDPRAPDFSFTPASDRRPRFGYEPAALSQEPVVSIVTPFLDAGEEFRETVRSVRSQSFQQWEWIVVDDGSTDSRALERLEEARRSDPRLRVISQGSNRGPAAARNAGVAAARGRYVLFVDSDDLLEPTAAEKWLWFLESFPGAGFVKGFTVHFGSETYLWDHGFHQPQRFFLANQVQTSSMIRRSVHEAAGGFDESIRGGFEDWDYWFRCAAAGHWGDTVPEYLDWYRRRSSHGDRWSTFDGGALEAAFSKSLRERYRRLRRGFPSTRSERPSAIDDLSFLNTLTKSGPRALLLVPWMSMGGSDKFNLDLVGQLVRRGWEVTIAGTRAGDQTWLPAFATLTPDVFDLSSFLRLDDAPRFLRYLIASRQPDALLVTHSELGYDLLPYLGSHFPRLPVLDYCHIEEPDWKDGGYPRDSVARRAWIDLHVVASRHLASWMTDAGARPDLVEVVTTNVDASRWRPNAELREAPRRALGVDQGTSVILFAGRLVAQKQPEVLARALAHLGETKSRFVAVIAGSGPGSRVVRRILGKSGLADRVRWFGNVSNDRVRELMAAADIFFLPSKWEGISLAVYEAMASGLAVVSADVGGQSELVTPETGVLVTRSSPETEANEYAAALQRLIDRPEERALLGRRAAERVAEHFPLSAMGDRMVELLNRAAALRAESPPVPLDSVAARAAAAEAVANARIVEGRKSRWARLESDPDSEHRGLRAKLYATAFRLHEPLYHWYSGRGWTWLDPVRRIARAILAPDR